MKIKIRNTRLTDFKAIKRILVEGGLSGPWFTPEALAKGIRRNRGFYMVAVVNDKVVGTVFASHDNWYYCFIYKLGVLSSHQNKGIGQKLVEAVIDKMKKIGIDWFFCGVRDGNMASLKLFSKLGADIGTGHRFVHKVIPS